MKLRRNISSLVILLVGLLATVAATGCHQQGMKEKRTSAQVGTHLVRVDRHQFHLGNTDYKSGNDFYKYAEHSPFVKFEFTLTGDRVAVDGKELGLVKANDELRIDDEGVVVRRADTNKWLDHGQTKSYLAENAQPVTAKK